MQVDKDVQLSFAIKGLELVKTNLQPQGDLSFTNEDILFNLRVEQKVNFIEKIIHVIIAIDLKIKTSGQELASIETITDFFVDNLDALKSEDGRNMTIPKIFSHTLSGISISTARGILYSLLKGTYLHSAILPVVDPTLLQQEVK